MKSGIKAYKFSAGAQALVIKRRGHLPEIKIVHSYFESSELRELAVILTKLANKLDKFPPYGK